MKNKVTVVIPLYREALPEFELQLLLNNLNVLKAHKITFVIPDNMNIGQLSEQFNIDKYDIVRVSEQWLGKINGIAGYNQMMTSGEFYGLFSDSEYILICQTDVYVFSDELDYWCDKGYDYIGAPWPKRKSYDNIFIKLYLQLRSRLTSRKKGLLRQDLFNKVGNGGFSLRKVDSSIMATDKYAQEVMRFAAGKGHLFHEDVFWAMVPEEFNYPTFSEALRFSFDVKPEYCYELNGGKLPFGCHGLTNGRIFKFWEDKIGK